MDKQEVAMWLSGVSPLAYVADDIQFAETMVLMYIRNQKDSEKIELTAEDLRSFDTKEFAKWIKDTLDEILFSKEIDTYAWWKEVA